MSQKTVFVVRSELDGGAPGYRYDNREGARQRASKLNKTPGVPDDHDVYEEVKDD